MFGEVFRFELRYQLSRRSTWLYFIILNALLLRLTQEAFFDQAREGGFFFNASFVIATASVFGGLFGMIMSAAVAGDAASRDVQLRMAPLMYTTPVGKRGYLAGRFLAAFAVVGAMMVAVPLGQYLLLWLPGLDPRLIGPFRPAGYLLAYASLLLPTTFVTTALMFSAALIARRAMAAFAVGAVLFISTLFTNGFIAQTKGMWALARMLDPFALTWMSEMTRQRTDLQKGQMLIGLEPTLLANRGLWIALACLVLAWAYARFSFVHEGTARPWRWWPTARTQIVADPLDAQPRGLPTAALAALPTATQRFDTGARMRQGLAVTVRSFREIVLGRGFLAVFAVAALVTLVGPEFVEHIGVPLVPVTGYLAPALDQAEEFFGFVAPLIAVFYAGELVWRERDAGLGPIADATPVHDWVPLLGKGLGLGLALAVWQGLLTAGGIITQLRMGYFDLQPLLWVQILFGLALSSHLLFAVLAIALHVLVNNKYAGHLVGLAAYGVMLFAPRFGLEHNMLVYASDPGWSYSDMRGFGGTLGPVLWFRLYWAGWALALAVVARLLWVRGAEQGAGQRLAGARSRFSAPVAATAALAALLVAGAGGVIFYNTNVLNEYASAAQREAQSVAYERRYGASADLPQPLVSVRRLHVELYPERREATITGRDTFVNRSRGPIDTLLVETSAAVNTGPLRFDRPVKLLRDDAEHRLRVVKLESPLMPGESLGMYFVLRFGGRGFSNNGIDPAIAAGASHFEDDWLPSLGYQRNRELSDERLRQKFGLPPKPSIPPLTDVSGRYNLRGHERILLDTTIGTVAGQTAVAPGRLQRRWDQAGRRYFRYVTDARIANSFGIYSAPYAVLETRWRDVAIRMYYHPAHAAIMPRLAHSVQASLARNTRVLGPYPASELTVVEAPGMGLSARAHSTSIRMFEGYALMNPDADWRNVDFASAVMAHEIGHQWWGSNQAAPAYVAGAPFLAESLAWYSAFGAIEDAKGAAHLQRILDLMRFAYLTPRSRDGIPLLEASDWFTAYRLGPFTMVALADAIGEERVNLALRRYLQKFGKGAPPLPTSMDLYAELKKVTPVAQHAFLADLFERNTFWDLSAKSMTAEPVGNAWRVTLEISADKDSVDTRGIKTRRPIPEAIEIGVYGPGADEEPGKTIYLRKHLLRPGMQRVTVMVPSRPASGGVDPRNRLIDPVPQDNTVALRVSP